MRTLTLQLIGTQVALPEGRGEEEASEPESPSAQAPIQSKAYKIDLNI